MSNENLFQIVVFGAFPSFKSDFQNDSMRMVMSHTNLPDRLLAAELLIFVGCFELIFME